MRDTSLRASEDDDDEDSAGGGSVALPVCARTGTVKIGSGLRGCPVSLEGRGLKHFVASSAARHSVNRKCGRRSMPS